MGKADLLLKVTKAEEAACWYADVLGWEREADGEGWAMLRMTGGAYALLMGEKGTHACHAAEGARSVEPGGRFYLPAPAEPGGLDGLEARVRGAGVRCSDESEPGCWRTLTVHTPEGYRAAYWQELFPGEDEIVALFEGGPKELETVLADLDEAQLDWTAAAGGWSIRQQVLHVVDLELAALHKLKFALASREPGREYRSPGFSQDDWAEGMRYADRPIGTEAALFRLVREHVLSVCRHVPGALARSVVTAGGGEESAGRLMKQMAGHANVHLRRIAEIRTLHGCPPARG
ncbi:MULTISPECIES: DinB family protein [Paenibacillus]|uniref:DinB family protein n=1 Tax=Paenibacillus TaxID=44249 RepID=UPI0022B874A5|nr:DinB family protein [Paenibacillus caseinilyticus]MCZ8519243.1 DinB family protein [Paenibacillus caseinilyticus]